MTQTLFFSEWLDDLDAMNRRRILSRLDRVENGNFGDCKEVCRNLFELRCFFGGGLRMYFTIRGDDVVLMLAGGNKSRQGEDIGRAGRILEELED